MACDAQTLIATAMHAGYAGMSERDLMMATLASACAAGGGIGGSGQIVQYFTTDPNTDGVVPANLNLIAIACKPSSTTYTWDPVVHTWT